MKTFAKLALFTLFVSVTVHAFAATVSPSWTLPTLNEDGSSIPATGPGSIASVRVQVGTCSSPGVFGTMLAENIVAPPALTTSFTGIAPASTVCFRAYAKNTYGEESKVSNIASRAVPAPVPQPPVLSATVNVAWREYSDGRFVLVGYLPMGTLCDPSTPVEKYGATFNRVPADAVKPFGGGVAKAGTYYGICSAS